MYENWFLKVHVQFYYFCLKLDFNDQEWGFKNGDGFNFWRVWCPITSGLGHPVTVLCGPLPCQEQEEEVEEDFHWRDAMEKSGGACVVQTNWQVFVHFCLLMWCYPVFTLWSEIVLCLHHGNIRKVLKNWQVFVNFFLLMWCCLIFTLWMDFTLWSPNYNLHCGNICKIQRKWQLFVHSNFQLQVVYSIIPL